MSNSAETSDQINCIGILLEADKSNNNNHALGFIAVKDTNFDVLGIRNLINEQISNLPSSYLFLTKSGWPVQTKQELGLHISHILSDQKSILIRKEISNIRVGIRLMNSNALGFIFVNKSSHVSSLRTCITQQLSELVELKNNEYRFIDSNQWPLMKKQENELVISDIMKYSEVIVEIINQNKHDRINRITSPHHKKLKRPKSLYLDSNNNKLQEPQDSSSSHSKISKKIGSSNQTNQIFISYVRNEASKHAEDLKCILEEYGYNAFLDVHEIEAGVDWQDSLNNALNDCQIFIALVTERYGRTKWTNREIKAADMGEKVIVPISFLDNWPPDCLAIQFSSTHYIPWKTEEDIKIEMEKGTQEFSRDVRIWDKSYVKRAAEIIVKNFKKDLEVPRPCSNEFNSFGYKMKGNDSPAPWLPQPNDKHNIVLSVHPKQKKLAHEMRLKLGEIGYEVWCSTDTDDLIKNHSDNEIMPLPVNSNQAYSILTENSEYLSLNLSNNSQNDFNLLEMTNSNLFARRNSMKSISSPVLKSARSIYTSQCSQISSASPGGNDKLEILRSRIKEASVVLLVLSEDYMKSRFSCKQAYYCQMRKKLLVVTTEKFDLTPWMSNLLDGVKFVNSNDFKDLKTQIKGVITPNYSLLPQDIMKEERMELMVKRSVAALGEPLIRFVYVSGSSKFYNKSSEAICCAIGHELAHLEFLALSTGGFYGVGESIGRNFCEERQILRKEERVFHFLPEQDSLKFNKSVRQDSDGKFLPVPYGKSFFIGENVRERECLVARLFKICILVEGGPRAAHEAEQFLWNDHIVIPVISTGGAAGGKYGIPSKAFICPPGIKNSEWSKLRDDTLSAEQIGKAVRNIVQSIHSSHEFEKSRASRKQIIPLSRQNTVPVS